MKRFLFLVALLLINLNLYAQESTQEVKPWTIIKDLHPENLRGIVWKATHDLDMYGYNIQVRELKSGNKGNISEQASIKHVKGKLFILYIKRGLGNDLVEMIYHELYHMIQIERGDLEIVENGYMWKGKCKVPDKTIERMINYKEPQ